MAPSIWGFLALFLSLAAATKDSNLTISLYAEEEGESCESGGAAKNTAGLTITTSTIPTALTCFNLSIFRSDEAAGYRNFTVDDIYEKNTGEQGGVDWYLPNFDDLSDVDLSLNYTYAWIEQYNKTHEAGAPGPWVVYTFESDDCSDRADLGSGRLGDLNYYKSSCQTEKRDGDEAGMCGESSFPINSFGISHWGDLTYADTEECQAWAYLNPAPKLEPRRVSMVAFVAFTVAVIMLSA